VVTDLVQIRELGASKEAENQRFRRYLSAHHHPIEAFQAIARDIEPQIDCTACANCCRYSIVAVDRNDIARIAQHLGMPAADVESLYTMPDPESPGRMILRSTADACVFLDGTLCMIYEARPVTCREFPHVGVGEHSLGARFSSVCRWTSLCPILYNAVERYKHLLGYR
jgi:Fe-S-cluster containining protein